MNYDSNLKGKKKLKTII